MTISRGFVTSTWAERWLAALAVALLLWATSVAVSSRTGFHGDAGDVPVSASAAERVHHAAPLPFVDVDADGDGMPDALLTHFEVLPANQLSVRRSPFTTLTRRLTGLQLTPLSGPPR